MKWVRTLLYNVLKVRERNVLFSVRGFEAGNSATRDHLEQVGRVFLCGYHRALSESDDRLHAGLSAIDDEYRGFAYEGAAMAKTLVDVLSFGKLDRIRDFLENATARDHIYMLHVGIGWAYARLPLDPEKEIEKFDPVLRWLIIDGYGFHEGYFQTAKFISANTLPAKIRSVNALHVFYQGIGRSLWFTEGAGVERIAGRILNFPELFRADLWSGLGLACAYAGGAKEEDLYRVRILSGSYLPEVMQGVSFAARARSRAGNVVENTVKACRIICNSTVEELSRITDFCLSSISGDIPPADQYAYWRSAIRKHLSKQPCNEETI